MLHRRAPQLWLAVTCVFSACSFDLAVPEQPQRGALFGKLDPGTHPLSANLGIRAIQIETGARFLTEADVDGAFRFADLPPGAYQLQSEPGGFTPLREGPFRVTAGSNVDAGVLTLTSLSSVTERGQVLGVVLVEGGASGSSDAGGRPSEAQGSRVEFLLEAAANAKIEEVTVNAYGTFSVRLPPGVYTLRASHPYFVATTRTSIEVKEAAIVDLASQPMILQLNPAEVSGSIVRELDGLPTTAPAAGALVSSDTGLSAVVDATGHFKLGGLAAGSRTLTLTLVDHHDEQPVRVLQLGAGEKTTLNEITLRVDRGALTGEVEMGDGTPLQQVTVDIPGSGYSTAASATTAVPSVGRFTLSQVAVGSYNVRASRQSYVSSVSSVFSVKVNTATDVGTLRLARVQGDFVIDDRDATNTPGFTRVTAVDLQLSNVANAVQYRVAEGSASALAAASYQSFSSNTVPFTLSTGDGLKTVYLQVKDAVGNEGSALSASVVLDQLAPTGESLELANGAAFTRVANPLPVTLSAFDPGSGVAWVRLSAQGITDGGSELAGPRLSYQRDTAFTRPTSADGVQTVFAQYTDNAGNVSPVVEASVVIDTLAPTGAVTLSRGPLATKDGYTNSLVAELVETPGGVEPNGGHLKLRLANDLTQLSTASLQPVSATAGWILDPSGQGAKQVHYQFVDAAGNEGAPGVASIIYDVTAPTVTASLTSANPANSATAALAFTVVEATELSPTAGLTLSESPSFSGAVPTAYPSSNAATLVLSSTDGAKTVFARVRDAAGNDAIASVGLVLDQTPPSGLAISLTGNLADGTESSTLSSSASVTITVSQLGATGIFLSGASLTVCPTTGYTTLAATTVSNHPLPGTGATRTVTACFIDAAGNLAGPVSDTIDVDLTAPTGCALALQGYKVDGTATTGALADKTALRDVGASVGSCSETPVEVALVEAAVTCTATALLDWRPLGSTTSFAVSSGDGSKSVRGCVRDAARNTGSLAVDSITLDTTPPTGASVLLDSGAAYVTLAQRTSRGGFIASAAGTATGATDWSLAEGTAPTVFTALASTSPQNFTFTATDGVKTVRALFRDDVGNITPQESSDSIEFDTAAPTLTAVAITGALADGVPSTVITSTAAVTLALTQTGGTQVFVGDNSLTLCPSSGYSSFSGGAVAATLTGSGTTRTVKVCITDGAGNPAGPVTASIGFDGTAPSGCALALQGYKADATAAIGTLAGQTALRDVAVAFTGCVEAPTAVFLTESTVTCSATASFDWRVLNTNTTFTLTSLDGVKTVRGCVRDAAFNVGTIAPAAMTLDTTAPTSASVTLDSGAAWVNRAAFLARSSVYRVSAQGSATGAFEWAVGSAPGPSTFTAFATTNPQNFTFSTGDGQKVLYAAFRDALGNTTSTIVSDDITFDTLPPDPAATVVTVVGPSQNEFTNSAVVTVKVVNGPSDAVFAKLAEATSTTNCVDGDVDPVTRQAVVGSYTMVLSPTEALKRVCLQWFDAAGNPSVVSLLSGVAETYADTITLDVTAPTSPQIVTADQVLALADGASFPVTIASASVDTNFSAYQRLGGKTSSWTVTSSPDAGLAFPFTIDNPPPAAETGVRNELRLRAVDQAGNASGESSVFITADINPPDAMPALLDEWIDNGDGRSTLYWNPSPSSDIRTYRLRYGSTASNLTGTFANEGASPIAVPNQTYFTLSGLPNGTGTYVTVTPIDLAGNAGTESVFKVLQPGTVSPNAVGQLNLVPNAASGNRQVQRLARMGSWLYAAVSVGNCASSTPSTCGSELYTIDMSGLESAIQKGSINPTPGVPLQSGAPLYFGNDDPVFNRGPDIVIDPPWLFMASGRFVHIINLNDPGAPTLYGDIDVSSVSAPYRINKLGQVGTRLIGQGPVADGTGRTVTYAINLLRMFDNDVATRPVNGNIQAVVSLLGYDNGALTRDRWIGMADNGGYQIVNLADAIDTSAATVWDFASDVKSQMGGTVMMASRPMISGNYLYGGSSLAGLTLFSLLNAATTNVWDAYGASPYSARLNMVPVSATAIFPAGQIDARGSIGFLPDSNDSALRVVDLANLGNITSMGLYAFGLAPTAALSWGHYAVVASATGAGPYLRFLEVATPRALTVRSTNVASGHEIDVRPGFAVTTGGWVFDLHNGSLPSPPGMGTVQTCTTTNVWMNDVEVGTAGSALLVRDVETLTDRDLTTSPTGGAPDTYSVALPATTRATGIAAWGNYLVVAEVRSPGGADNGYWLEVFDARALRDRQGLTQLSAADSVATLQLRSTSADLPTTMIDVTLTDGRAAVSIDNGVVDSIGNNVMFVDLRPAFDDNETTNLSVAGSIQGTLTGIPRTFRTVIAGQFAYLATGASTTIRNPMLPGFIVADVHEAMDNNVATLVPGVPNKAAMLLATPVESVTVYGSAVFLSPGGYNETALYVIDVSKPLQPQPMGYYPWHHTNASCQPAGDSDRRLFSRVEVAGPRLFATPGRTFQEFNLE